MNYTSIYQKIIKSAQERASSKKEANLILGYSEAHHIIPRCMGGTNELKNIAHLSAREHFICHILLVKMYPTEYGLLEACHRMMYDKQGNKLNGKSYNNIKKKYSDYRKTQNKNNNNGIAKSAEKHKGRTKETHEYIARASIKRTGRTKENHPSIAKMANSKKNRTKETHEGILQQSQKISGRTKETHSGVATISQKKTGQSKETCPGVAIMAEKLNKLPIMMRKIIACRRKTGESFSSIHEWLISFGYDITRNALYHIVKRT